MLKFIEMLTFYNNIAFIGSSRSTYQEVYYSELQVAS